MKKIKVEIPLEFAIEIATYGETGKVSRLIQTSFQKELKKLGFENELNVAREKKLNDLFGNIKRVLGDENVQKINDSIETAKNAIKVATRLNNKN